MQQAALRRASVLQRQQTNAFLQLSPLVRLVSCWKRNAFSWPAHVQVNVRLTPGKRFQKVVDEDLVLLNVWGQAFGFCF